ncbi:hypothetical protein LCGC14_2036980, partial [marine sediment metagenome]
MPDSTAKNFAIPTTLANVNPAPIARGSAVATRALIRNTGAVMVFVGYAPEDVANSDGPGAGAFRIAPGDSDVFVMMPMQVLYAIGAGLGGRVS